MSATVAAAAFSCSSSSKPPAASGDAAVGNTSSSGNPAEGGGSSGASGSSGTSGASGGLHDGSSDAPGEGGGPTACNAVTPGGAGIPQTVSAGAPDAAAGGTITPGTYVLTERDVYTGGSGEVDASAADGQSIKGVLVFTSSTVDTAYVTAPAAGGPAVTTTTSGTWKPYGAVLSTTESCPYAKQVSNVPFTVSGTQIWLYSTTATATREVYTRQ